MGRKDFLKDFEAIQGTTFPQITAIDTGTETGEFSFAYVSDLLPNESVVIQSLIPEVSAYPLEHDYLLFTQSDENVPTVVSRTLETVTPTLKSLTLLQMLEQVTAFLNIRLTQGDSDNPVNIDKDDEADSLDGDAISVAWSDQDMHFDTIKKSTLASKKTYTGHVSDVSRRTIISDLQAVKNAGFRVGVLGDIHSGGVVCVSIRVRKLGISEEAMQAWNLRRKQYLVLMIKHQGGYRTLGQVKEDQSFVGRTEMRVALCARYKPSLPEALNAFTPASHIDAQQPSTATQIHATSPGQNSGLLLPLFIGRPINGLLANRFARILKFRVTCAYKWMGAEDFVNDTQGKTITSEDVADPKYYRSERHAPALSKLVTADHINEAISVEDMSLPLATMQFVLRHLVRCTEFCLVCHCKIDATFEALKPYVCDKGLCLYQYLSLGFGPSIEWEIVTQPYVVDVLVSFCYASAQSGRLKDFPNGTALRVPLLPRDTQSIQPYTGYAPHMNTPVAPSTAMADAQPSFEARFDHELSEMVFDSSTTKCPVRVGDWLVVQSKSSDGQTHYRVLEVHLFPTIRFDGKGIFIPKNRPETHKWAITTPAPSPPPPASAILTKGLMPVQCFLYDRNLDELDIQSKYHCIMLLLSTLPSIMRLRTHLLQQGARQDMSLRGLRAEVSDSALELLRWIIASNRSCIMQVDKLADKHKASGLIDNFSGAQVGEDRVSGMDTWVQFRFAQGAPDKEQRFMNCLSEVNRRTGQKQYPTLFAWHGSPLGNWHSIVREGLHFNDTLHGRSFGNGVYMSPECTTSLGYSNMYMHREGLKYNNWPNSVLQISTALSLNEVVNARNEFVSGKPHYVVDKIDWIQTRYLFVSCAEKLVGPTDPPATVYAQDPSASAYDEKGAQIVIPITTVCKSRRPGKHKSASNSQQTVEDAEDDADSDTTDGEDRNLLLHHDKDLDEYGHDGLDSMMSLDLDRLMPRKRAGDVLERSVRKKTQSQSFETDFIPGTLNLKGLKMLQAPTNASVNTTRTLMRILKETLEAQKVTPLHELGWYLDGESVTNMYQWVVELHSFDSELPLAEDMKAADLKSIVVEMRFTNSFPYSPPFVRVISPRFVPFSAGGGGHVTAGGAICMELLTNDGWLPSNTIESVLMQVRLELSSTDPPARLERSGRGESFYGIGEAIEAYKRACMIHGWKIPADFDSLQKE